jgi:hypothetical protein
VPDARWWRELRRAWSLPKTKDCLRKRRNRRLFAPTILPKQQATRQFPSSRPLRKSNGTGSDLRNQRPQPPDHYHARRPSSRRVSLIAGCVCRKAAEIAKGKAILVLPFLAHRRASPFIGGWRQALGIRPEAVGCTPLLSEMIKPQITSLRAKRGNSPIYADFLPARKKPRSGRNSLDGQSGDLYDTYATIELA